MPTAVGSLWGNDGYPRDVGDRWLRRIFNNGQFDHGGRLYGGFWQDLSAETRLSDIRLNDEPIASLDFGQCGLRIAYGVAGAQPPEGDLYCIPGLERFRDGVKVVINSMLASSEGLKRKPAGSGKHFPRHRTIRQIEELIFRHHHAVRHLCYSGAGWRLQFLESQVLVRGLLQLMCSNIPALPVHDCILVPASAGTMAKKIMLESFKDITGVEGVIRTHTDTSIPSIGPSVGGDYGGDNYSSPSPPHKRGA